MIFHVQLYLVSPHAGYRAFEDYYDTLSKLLMQQFTVIIIIFQNQMEIPLDDHGFYLFFGIIPPAFINHKNVYLLNTEQLTRPTWLAIIQRYIASGITIFDFDRYQTTLSQSSLHHYLPYQIDPDEDTYLRSKMTPKQYDVAFCSVNGSNRRQLIFSQLIERGLKVIDVCGWKGSRDMAIASAKILVNIHFDTNYQIFEHMRCDRWILAGMLVISEESQSDHRLDHETLLIIEKYENLVETIINAVNHYESYYDQYLSKLNEIKPKIIKERLDCYQRFIDQIKL